MLDPTPARDSAADGLRLLAIAGAAVGGWGLIRSVPAASDAERALARWHRIAAALMTVCAAASDAHCARTPVAHPGPPLRNAEVMAFAAMAHGIGRAFAGRSWSFRFQYDTGGARFLTEFLAWSATLAGLMLVAQC